MARHSEGQQEASGSLLGGIWQGYVGGFCCTKGRSEMLLEMMKEARKRRSCLG